MKRPTVVNVQAHTPGPDDVYIGRPSKWGNPFKLGRYSRWAAISLFRRSIPKRFTQEELASLAGKTLVCYCSPKACHGDALADAVEALP